MLLAIGKDAQPIVWRKCASAVASWVSRFYILIVLAVTGGIYAPTLNDPFHGDDYVAFTEFKTKTLWAYCHDVFVFKDLNFYWRPLGKVFHRLLYEGFGLDPAAYHVAALIIFLATVACVYVFCLKEGLGRAVALGAAAAFGLLPSHVVGVAWVTNSSRLMAVLFFMLCLLVLQRATSRFKYAVELGALLLFVCAVLSDETALGLAPVPLLYSTFVRNRRFDLLPALGRLVFYGAMAVALIPMQFTNNINDEPRLSAYSFGPHVVSRFWALASQLVLPISPSEPFDLVLSSIEPEQWGAGLLAIVAGGLLFLVGSRTSRFLVLWTALALAPFTLWDLSYTSPRYVYMAAVPYSVVLSWAVVAVLSFAVRGAASWKPRLPVAPVLTGAAAFGLAFVLFIAGQSVLDRNDAWGRETEKYGLLADGFRRDLPDVPHGSRIIILYGPWPDFWATSLAQTIYGDRSLRVVSVPPERVDGPRPALKSNDLVLYFMGGRLIPESVTSLKH